MSKQSVHEKFLAQIHQLLPEVVRLNDAATREIVQTVVWLVGLSTGFLALLAARPEVLALLGPWRFFLIPALLGVVVLGLAQRLLQQVVDKKQIALHLRLQIHFWAFTVRFDDPDELMEWWTPEEILERLKNDFGLDYSFLKGFDFTRLEDYREAYSKALKNWKEDASKTGEDVQRLMRAIAGKDEPASASGGEEGNAVDDIRNDAKSINRWSRWGDIAFWTQCIVFVSSAIALVVALLMSPPAKKPPVAFGESAFLRDPRTNQGQSGGISAKYPTGLASPR